MSHDRSLVHAEFVLSLLLVIVVFFFPWDMTCAAEEEGAAVSSFVSCECEQSTCGPCEIKQGTSFYTAKCGPNLSKVKSCKKPTCVPVENQQQCLTEFKGRGADSMVGASASANVDPNVNSSIDRRAQGDGSRLPSASAGGTAAGEIVAVIGSVRVSRAKGGVENARVKLAVFEGDVVETMAGARVKMVLKDLSEVLLTPSTKLRISTVRTGNGSGSGSDVAVTSVAGGRTTRQVTLDLVMGKVRNHVIKTYDTHGNTFRVRTRTAVAGVRGTDFVASYEPGEKEWITEISTFNGRVSLNPIDAEGNPDPGKQVDIEQRMRAAFIVKAPPKGVGDDEFKKLVAEGFLTPLFNMKPDEVQLLDEATDMKAMLAKSGAVASKVSTATATASDVVCQEPDGQYNQCSWTCEGNPKGEKKCRTDLGGVSCVRRLCRANGQWAEAKRMPASQSDACLPDRVVVRECGSYW